MLESWAKAFIADMGFDYVTARVAGFDLLKLDMLKERYRLDEIATMFVAIIASEAYTIKD